MKDKWRPEGWHDMVGSPYMHDGVEMMMRNPTKALELELQHQAFRKGQEAGADAMLDAVEGKIRDIVEAELDKMFAVMDKVLKDA